MHPEMSNLDWFEYIKTYGSKPGLKSIKILLSILEDPQKKFQSIHVTGTNGKGSTTSMLASILQAAGYRVGMFTSPHLSRVTESIKVNGEEIPECSAEALLGEIRNKISIMVSKGSRHPTHFEVLVALAFKHFAVQGVEIAAVE
ncbi:bifunctional folylpolyglutamate synthase/dihydrofolate synthase, partial [Thermoproteota archaeon]